MKYLQTYSRYTRTLHSRLTDPSSENAILSSSRNLGGLKFFGTFSFKKLDVTVCPNLFTATHFHSAWSSISSGTMFRTNVPFSSEENRYRFDSAISSSSLYQLIDGVDSVKTKIQYAMCKFVEIFYIYFFFFYTSHTRTCYSFQYDN